MRLQVIQELSEKKFGKDSDETLYLRILLLE